MEFIALPVFVFLEIFKWILILEIILSWLAFLGILVAIPFISSIVNPVLDFVRKYLPVQFMGLDFSVLILLWLIWVAQHAIILYVPEIIAYLPQFALF